MNESRTLDSRPEYRVTHQEPSDEEKTAVYQSKQLEREIDKLKKDLARRFEKAATGQTCYHTGVKLYDARKLDPLTVRTIQDEINVLESRLAAYNKVSAETESKCVMKGPKD